MRRTAAAAALVVLACDLGGDVDHRGRYGFLPGQGSVSTAPLPLRRLLVVESDASADRARFYLFEGELGEAGIGVDDLRKLALGFNRFDLSFALPAEAAAPSGEAGAGADPGADSAAETRTLDVDSESIELRALMASELVPTGAGRFATALDGADFGVRAYFGVRAGAAPPRRVSLEQLNYAPELRPLELGAELSESTLVVRYGEPRALDYLELALVQPVIRSEDQQRLDAGVTTRLWSGTVYAPSFELLTNVFEQGCWSLEAPLTLRATQFSQSYWRRAGGDFAVVERRTDQLELAPEEWNPAIAEARAVDYCSTLEPFEPPEPAD